MRPVIQVRPARREFLLTLLLGAAGAGLAVLAVRQTWAEIRYFPPAPLPAQHIAVTGSGLAPAAFSLALASSACLAAVIATRGVARRLTGVVLAAFGVGTALVVHGALRSANVLAAAASQAGSPSGSLGAGSTTSGTPAGGGSVVISGSPAHVVVTGAPWQVTVVVGGAAVVAAGLLTAWRGGRWPVMSGRFDRQATQPAQRHAGAGGFADDPAMLWDALSRGVDPTGSDDTNSATVSSPPTAGPSAAPPTAGSVTVDASGQRRGA